MVGFAPGALDWHWTLFVGTGVLGQQPQTSHITCLHTLSQSSKWEVQLLGNAL